MFFLFEMRPSWPSIQWENLTVKSEEVEEESRISTQQLAGSKFIRSMAVEEKRCKNHGDAENI